MCARERTCARAIARMPVDSPLQLCVSVCVCEASQSSHVSAGIPLVLQRYEAAAGFREMVDVSLDVKTKCVCVCSLETGTKSDRQRRALS